MTVDEYDRVKVVLLNLGISTYDQRIKKHESPLNSNHTRDIGVVAEEIASEYGSKQCLIIWDASGNTTSPLVFDGDILIINLLQPTEENFFTLDVNWITPVMV